jgi:serine-type D-Ala-D-Ala carboxypeptidase/endopeptidase
MTRATWLAALACACGSAHQPGPVKPTAAPDSDPDGPHRIAVAALVQPFIDAQVATSIVVGLYDAGKLEIYGFGTGAAGKPPTGHSLYEIGSLSKIYTSLLLADAVQRHELELDTPLSELLPPGVTAPTKDKVAITLRELALHASGLPKMPPSRAAAEHAPDPYVGYDEDALYQDLVRTELADAPGTKITYSDYGIGVLGFAVAHKIGKSYADALTARVLTPLGMHDTFVHVPEAARARVVQGTNDDLQPVPAWTWGPLAGAGGVISSVHDQLALIAAEIDAASDSAVVDPLAKAGSPRHPLGPVFKLTQEEQLKSAGANESLGWEIDTNGRYWHNGSTGGYHSFIGFDPKTRRGLVIVASSAVTIVDRLVDLLYKVAAGDTVTPPVFPTAAALAAYVGRYDFGGTPIEVTLDKRLYIQGPGEPKVRLVPLSDHEFWIEKLQGVVVFEKDGDHVKQILFLVNNQTLPAPRIETPAAP